MIGRRMRPLLLVLLATLGCTETRSAQCKEVCKREAECVDQTASKMPDNGAKVQRHIDCVHKQNDCAAILECR